MSNKLKSGEITVVVKYEYTEESEPITGLTFDDFIGEWVDQYNVCIEVTPGNYVFEKV